MAFLAVRRVGGCSEHPEKVRVTAGTVCQSALLATQESRALWRLAGVTALHPGASSTAGLRDL